MVLSDIQKLSVEGKLEWLQSSEGLCKLQEWLLDNASLRRVAKLLSIDVKTIYRWREHYPAIAEVIAPYIPATQGKTVNLARLVAYRIIAGFNHSTIRQYPQRGCTVICEFDTAPAVWNSDFIQDYFQSFGVSRDDYLSDFLKKISREGVHHLSNLFSVAYCDVTRRGVIRVLKGGTLK